MAFPFAFPAAEVSASHAAGQTFGEQPRNGMPHLPCPAPGMVRLGFAMQGCPGLSLWGKIIGGVAGFAMGGPMGAVVGAALGHAADSGAVSDLRAQFAPQLGWNPARLAAMFNRRDQLFAICAVVLSAKLAKCDGQVKREEIDAFKRQFRIPPEAVRDIGRLFDQARDSAEGSTLMPCSWARRSPTTAACWRTCSPRCS